VRSILDRRRHLDPTRLRRASHQQPAKRRFSDECGYYPDSGIEDVAYLNPDFGGGLLASFHVNWLSPVKIRHFLVGGSRKGLVYNDLTPMRRSRSMTGASPSRKTPRKRDAGC
jgi:hypothetical protein